MHYSLALSYFAGVALAVPYSQYILSPSNRTLFAEKVYRSRGTVSNAETILAGGSGNATISPNSSIALDFGKNIGGIVTVDVLSSDSGALSLTFSESSLWVSDAACDGTADSGLDSPYNFTIIGAEKYILDADHERGGFRYLSLVNNGTSSISIGSVSVNFTAMPHVQDPSAYTGWFHSNDEGVNRVWYAGAYTNQLCTIDPKQGDSLIHLGEITTNSTIELPETVSWHLNTTIANGTSALTDGAKRDRIIWPGDLVISAPSVFVSYGDLVTIKNSLDSLLVLQDDDGRLPYAGQPFITTLRDAGVDLFSFTYHLHSLIDISLYYKFTRDTAWLSDNWSHFTKGLNYSLSNVDSTGLMNVTTSADWLRDGMGGHNIEANAILYYTIQQGLGLAKIVNDTSRSNDWQTAAEKLKSAANDLLYDSNAGLYRDNETTTLYPQDGNVWAIKANLTNGPSQALTVAKSLHDRWTQYGPPAPEAGDTVSPFISSFEIEAHYLANDPQTALDLIRLMWVDFMLDDPRMTNSTFIEGYSTNGDLHYKPYKNDPRISHAHGWATGPTSALSFYAAGLQVEDGGSTWIVSPQPGNLTDIDAGFETPLGTFTSKLTASNGAISSLNFSTPADSTGSIGLRLMPEGMVTLSGSGKNITSATNNGEWSAEGLTGGNWTVVFKSTGVLTGDAVNRYSASLTAVVLAIGVSILTATL